MSFVGPRPDVPGYADKLVGEDRDVLKLRPDRGLPWNMIFCTVLGRKMEYAGEEI